MPTPEAVYLAVAKIPRGKVATYGDIAKLAGINNPRIVGRILSRLPNDTQIPWHRVINAKGKISLPENSLGYSEQKQRLVSDGVNFSGERINLQNFRWRAY